MTYTLGVDLGTTFTAAAVVRDGRASIVNLGNKRAEIPSVVVVREDGTVLTGEAAERRAISEPRRVGREFKRRLGDTTPLLLGGSAYSAEALMARLLRSVVDDVIDREGGEPEQIAVCHPANWGPYKTDLLKQALQIAELDAVLLTEPEAAAISYAHAERLSPGETIAVYDLGGGTFDAAVLRATKNGFEILGAPVGIERLGGIDFDAAVMGHITSILADELAELDEDDPNVVTAYARLRQEAIEARETLSSDTEVDIPVIMPGINSTIRLTRGELEAMIRPAVGDSVAALRRAVDGAGVSAADLRAVLLVGGTSRTPLVASLVGEELGRPVVVDADPKYAIALGAAHHAATSLAAASAANGKKRGSSRKRAAKPAKVAKPAAAAATPPAPIGADEATVEPAATAPVTAPQPRVAAASEGRGGGIAGVPPIALAGAAVLVLVLIVGGFMFLRGGDDEVADPGGEGTTGDAVDASFVRTTVDEGSMVLVDVTDPVIGTDDLTPSADPPEYVAARTVTGRQTFYVDVDSATNRQFYDFVSFTSANPNLDAAEVWERLAPAEWQQLSATVPETFGVLGLPDGAVVLGMSWEAADEYCNYALKRLVTEVEWEIAAAAGLIDVSANQNWVADPEGYGDVPDGARVMRGSFGIEGLPVAHRTIGDSPANRLNVGIRCAADDVVEVPSPVGVTSYVREFSPSDEAFDWPDFHDANVPEMAFGYHAPDVFHIEARDARRVVVLAGQPQGTDASIQADLDLRLPVPVEGSFGYGLVASAGNAGYVAFVLRPVADGSGFTMGWCVVQVASPLSMSGERFSATPTPSSDCAAEGTHATNELRSTIGIDFGGPETAFTIDGAQVAALAVPADAQGDFGFVLDNYDGTTIAHAHYDNLVVKATESAPEPQVAIGAVTSNAAGGITVEFDAQDFTPGDPAGPSLVFYWNDATAEQAISEGRGTVWNSPDAFTGFSTLLRPMAATSICAVIADSGAVASAPNCVEVDANALAQGMPGGRFVKLDAVTLDGSTYIVDYTPVGYDPVIGAVGTWHVHFYWATTSNEDNVGVNIPAEQRGSWAAWDRDVFDSFTVSQRPPDATAICGVVAEQTHEILLQSDGSGYPSGTCVTLPG